MNKEKYLKRFQNLDMHNLNTLYAKHRKNLPTKYLVSIKVFRTFSCWL
jgi:hypothetical protein